MSGGSGWLFSLGISQEKILKYEEAVKAGKFLLIAHGPEETVERASRILEESKAEQLDQHAPEPARPAGAGV